MYQTLISPDQLKDLIQSSAKLAIFDCRFKLSDKDHGRCAYKMGHIPGSVYVHLDDDLSGEIKPETGRHPLPNIAEFAASLSQWGVDEHTQVVAYDDMGGAIAARLWWMLQWLGHQNTAVLDGGIAAWEGPLSTEETKPAPAMFTAIPQEHRYIPLEELQSKLNDPQWRIIDARGPERYRGEVEPIDPVAGHIPGAINAFFKENLNEQGKFLGKAALKTRFQDFLIQPEKTVIYCGSGVTAAHNILAIAHAGLGQALLFPGSWSQWVADPQRPVAIGQEHGASL